MKEECPLSDERDMDVGQVVIYITEPQSSTTPLIAHDPYLHPTCNTTVIFCVLTKIDQRKLIFSLKKNLFLTN